MSATASINPAGEIQRHEGFFRQSGWLMFANIAGGMLMWGVHFLSKAIPKPEYAVFGVFLAVAMVIPTVPLQMVLAHQTAQALATSRQGELAGKIRLILFLTFGVWLAGAIVVAIFNQEILQRWQITNPAGLWITLPVLLLALCLPVFWGVQQGKQDFFSLGWSMMLNGVGRIGIAAFAVLALGSYATGMMSGVLIGMILSAAVAIWTTRGLWSSKPVPYDRRDLLNQVIPLMLGFTAFQFLLTADTIFAKAYFDGDSVAAYVGAGTMARALMWLVGPLATVMFPRVVHSAARSENTGLVRLVLVGTAVLSIAGALFLWVFGSLVVRFVYKANYLEIATVVLPWYAFAMVPLALGNVLLNDLMARRVFRMVPPLCLLALAYGFALTQFHGSLVIILQTLGVCNTIFLLICAWYSRRTPTVSSPGAHM